MISDALAVCCCIIMLFIMVCVVFWSINGDLVHCVAVGTEFLNVSFYFSNLCQMFQNLCLRGNVKINSIFVDSVQIEVDLPPSYPIFDKFIFDKVLIMLTSLPPLEFLTKIMKF